MPAKPAGLTRDQVELALHQINPSITYRWLDDGSYEFRGPGQQPSDAAITAAWAEVQTVIAAEATAEAADATDRAQLAALDSALETYIGTASPTLAQTATAVKALCRFARYVIRRLVRKGVL